MKLRDHIAIEVLKTLLLRDKDDYTGKKLQLGLSEVTDYLADYSYEIADLMIKRRKEKADQ